MAGHQHSPAWDTGVLPVDPVHTLYYEQYGKQDGKSALFLHGGPGGSTSPSNTAFFNPSIYRVVLFDQRGGGKSTPSASLTDNTTHHLVTDIETLRQHLGIEKWHLVFGGSWGSTLALYYAQTHPDRVGCLVLRGIFTITSQEMEWSFPQPGYGASRIFPDAYEEFAGHLYPEERGDILRGYHKLLTSDDRETQVKAARVWNTWELKASSLVVTEEGLRKVEDEKWSLAHARIEAHYFVNKAWIGDGELVGREKVDRIRHIPTTIVQGRYDIVCPAKAAWDLYKAFPEAKMVWVPDAGHSALEPGTFKELVKACDEAGGREG